MTTLSLVDLRFLLRQIPGRLRRVVRPVTRPVGPVLRLHLGCGEIDKPGFVNIDGIDRPHVHFVARIDRLPQFADNSVEFIYCSHALEHFSNHQTRAVLREWCRLLKPGGRLCVSVPDFDVIVAMYQHSGRQMREIVPVLFGGQDYPFNTHYTGFNEAGLIGMMRATGYASAARWQPGQDKWHDFPDWSNRSIEVGGRAFAVSLNVEAVK